MTEQEFIDSIRDGASVVVIAALAVDPALAVAIGEHDMTPLHYAAEVDHAPIATLLLDAGADIEAKSDWGATALDWAATMGSNDVATVLLRRGADGLDFINAASLGLLGRVKVIADATQQQQRRAAPDAPDEHWPVGCAHLEGDMVSDAFYSACRNGHIDVADYLLDNGADVDARGVFGGTALHWAAHRGHGAMVERLLLVGADADLRDDRFDATPAAWAREGGFEAIAVLIEAARGSRG